jgi:thiamine-phosphate pyrophosphorylase
VNGDQRRTRLDASRLYVCTPGRNDLDEFLDTILAAGVDVVQLREDKAMEARPLLELAARFRAACDRHDALFIVNDRPDLALAAGADGVHLGQDDVAPEIARRILGPDAIIGRSTHAPEEIERAGSEPIDYVVVGPCFATPTKPGRRATGLLLLSAAAGLVLPWFAIGGLDERTLPRAVAAGARRAVIVRAITEAADPSLAVKRLREPLL